MRRKYNRIIVKIILPFMITAVLFVTAVFLVIIPAIRHRHIERKKQAIKDLTMTGWKTLIYYNSLANKGVFTKEKAQEYARDHIRSLRYGPEMKNYFWIITMKGLVVADPCNIHVEGRNHIALSDANGKFFIRDFIKTARDRTGGFVKHDWQWDDDPDRVVTKISYVKQFRDWGWIVGTSVCLDDIDREVNNIATIIFFTVLIIFLIVSLLSFYIVRNFIDYDKRRFKRACMAKQTESKIRLMIEVIPDMILRIDKTGRVLDVKEPVNFKPFLNPGKMLGASINEAWPENIAGKAMGAVLKTFETSKPQIIIFNIEVGKKRKTSMKLEAYFVKYGKKEVLATFRDITRRDA